MDFGDWLKQERRRRGWKAEEVARRLRDAGYEAQDGSYRVWESGRRPKAETVAALERMFGSPAPDAAQPAESAMVELLREQTAELRRVWPAIRQANERQDVLLEKMDRQTLALEAVAGNLASLAAAIRSEQDRFTLEQVTRLLVGLREEGLLLSQSQLAPLPIDGASPTPHHPGPEDTPQPAPEPGTGTAHGAGSPKQDTPPPGRSGGTSRARRGQ